MRYCYSLTQTQTRSILAGTHPPDVGFEIRLDTFTAPPDPAAIRAATHQPLMATFRTTAHAGKGSHTDRNAHGWTWRQSCLRAGFEYIDLELDEPRIEAKIREIHAHGARVVLSHHDPGGSGSLSKAWDLAYQTKADVIKLIGTGTQTGDFKAHRERYCLARGRDLIHFFMGAEFTASRVLSMLYGAPFTFVASDQEHSLAPGQLSYEQMRHGYRPEAIQPAQLSLFAVIGWPIGHSQSPPFHNPRLKSRDPNALFVALPARSQGNLATLLETFPELRGMAVTKPMKTVAHAHAQRFIDDASRKLGAANTLLFGEKEVTAANTDYQAILKIIANLGVRGPVRVLGYGGLGKAVVRACLALDLDTEICNRSAARLSDTPSRARVVPWPERHREGPTLIIQATSAGMAPQVTQTPLERLPQSATHLLETIYHPRETNLLRMARERGLNVIDGAVLFHTQADIQASLFLNQLPRGECRSIFNPVANKNA